ncbi:MAG: 2-hydroxyhepta-2,4-diene-1,7-dioate isomerase, partial [Verrucomicrobia bacterium]|nr:2-hydroxyhepta-2,4-diene-1,7-dioate isomerase [Verrucomicrobiota bacterium]
MHLYRTSHGIYLHQQNWFLLPDQNWDALIDHENLQAYLAGVAASGTPVGAPAQDTILAPIGTQEVWAAGVTYFRSRT